MGLFLAWITLSVVIGFVGSGRKIGFAGAFFLSLLLSPLIGLIIALTSKNVEEEKYKDEILKTQKQQSETLQKMASVNEIEQLYNLMQKGILTEEEFNDKKKTLLGSINQIQNIHNLDDDMIKSLSGIKKATDKNKVIEFIFEYVKTRSVTAEQRNLYSDIVDDVVNGKYELKPFEKLADKYYYNPNELLNVKNKVLETINL